MEQLAQTRQEYTSQRDLCAAQLQELHDEQAQYEIEQSQMPCPSQIDYAVVQVQCMHALHDACRLCEGNFSHRSRGICFSASELTACAGRHVALLASIASCHECFIICMHFEIQHFPYTCVG